jgi:CRP/FNR family transcriptional regulator, cyclic AMP receptor protein
MSSSGKSTRRKPSPAEATRRSLRSLKVGISAGMSSGMGAIALPLPSLHIPQLAALGISRSFRRGVVFIQEGDIGDALYIITSGKVRAYSSDHVGREITLGVYGPGDYVGEMSLDGGPRSATVETLDVTACSVVTRKTLLAYISNHPEFALEMITRVIRRARVATSSARNMALLDVYGRLAQMLTELSDPPAEDGTRTIAERLTHLQMAGLLACSREMVSRLLKELQTGGYLQLKDRRLVILKPLPPRW